MLLIPFSTWTLAALPWVVSAVPPSYVEKGHNTFGAILFFSYIFAALYITSYVLFSISHIRPQIRPSSKSTHTRETSHTQKRYGRVSQGRNRRAFGIFSTLAAMSFAILSWNMLNFLIASYMRWASTYGIPTALRLQSFDEVWHDFRYIWIWATNSNLFQTFAEDLVSDPDQWKIVRAALIYSYTSNTWMSAMGNAANIPDLWTYFVLDQILPVSFTQNLFCVALTRTTAITQKSYKVKQDRSFIFYVKSVGLLCYLAVLYRIPSTVDTTRFFPTLFTLRGLLFFPYLVECLAKRLQVSSGLSSRLTTANFNRILMAMTVIVLVQDIRSGPRIIAGRSTTSPNTNYAAATLSHDLLIGILGSVTYFLLFQR